MTRFVFMPSWENSSCPKSLLFMATSTWEWASVSQSLWAHEPTLAFANQVSWCHLQELFVFSLPCLSWGSLKLLFNTHSPFETWSPSFHCSSMAGIKVSFSPPRLLEWTRGFVGTICLLSIRLGSRSCTCLTNSMSLLPLAELSKLSLRVHPEALTICSGQQWQASEPAKPPLLLLLLYSALFLLCLPRLCLPVPHALHWYFKKNHTL